MKLRKAKKAYKLGRKNKWSEGYKKYLLLLEARRIAALRCIQTALCVAMGAAQVRLINSMPILKNDLDARKQKALRIDEIAVGMAEAVVKIYR